MLCIFNVFESILNKFENSQELTKCNPRSHQRHPYGKRQTKLLTTEDIISVSYGNSHFPCTSSKQSYPQGRPTKATALTISRKTLNI